MMTLYSRLERRGYTGKKLEDNIQCEIFETILQLARITFTDGKVFELKSDNIHQIPDNISKIRQWIDKWKLDNQEE